MTAANLQEGGIETLDGMSVLFSGPNKGIGHGETVSFFAGLPVITVIFMGLLFLYGVGILIVGLGDATHCPSIFIISR